LNDTHDERTPLSLGERVSHSGEFISRSATGEGSPAELQRGGERIARAGEINN